MKRPTKKQFLAGFFFMYMRSSARVGHSHLRDSAHFIRFGPSQASLGPSPCPSPGVDRPSDWLCQPYKLRLASQGYEFSDVVCDGNEAKLDFDLSVGF